MLYGQDCLNKALQSVLEDGKSIRGAAKLHNVPYTTLNDRVNGRIGLEATRPGPKPLMTSLEEKTLVDHINHMASVGPGYSRQDVMTLVADFLASVGKRDPGKVMSDSWFYNFLSRWPELKIAKT